VETAAEIAHTFTEIEQQLVHAWRLVRRRDSAAPPAHARHVSTDRHPSSIRRSRSVCRLHAPQFSPRAGDGTW